MTVPVPVPFPTSPPFEWPFCKSPGSTIDFQWNWGPSQFSATGWLNGDTIIASTWAVTTTDGSTPLVLGTSGIATPYTFIWTSGGTTGVSLVTNHITTAGGRTMDWTQPIRILAT